MPALPVLGSQLSIVLFKTHSPILTIQEGRLVLLKILKDHNMVFLRDFACADKVTCYKDIRTSKL